MHIMGDYAKQGAPGLLLAKRNESHPTEVADLEGARFVANVEPEKGKPFAESLIKQLTGSDPISARRMRQDFYQFMPTHKMCIAANHKPIIKGNDEGIWRRMLRLPWKKKIEKYDPFYLDKLKAEAPGILARLVEGCLAWQREGLSPPDAVTMATEAYREEMDVLAEFLDECCDLDESLSIGKKELYMSYLDWCDSFRQRPNGYALFNRQLSERDFDTIIGKVQIGKARKSIRQWKGIAAKRVQAHKSPTHNVIEVMKWRDK
jgi:putative DNA primase/helicase